MAQGQWLSNPRYQVVMINGQPNAGGSLTFYVPGTSTLKNTFSDLACTIANTNPVILDSYGSASIVLNGFYDIDVKDKNGNLIYPRQSNVSAQYNYALTSGEWTAPSLVPVFINATQFSISGDVRSTYSVNRRVEAVVTAGTIYGTITVSSYGGGITTITVLWDSGSLDSGLSQVFLGVVSPTTASYNGSLPISLFLPGIPTATMGIDNDATTQLATDSFVKGQIGFDTGAHGKSQAVNMTAAVSGSSGIAIADNANLAFGTTSGITMVWHGSLPVWGNTGTPLYLMHKFQDYFNRWGLYIESSTRFLVFYVFGTGGTTIMATSTAIVPFPNNTFGEVSVSIVRETASVAGSVTFYWNGIQLGSVVTIPANTPPSMTNTGTLYVLGAESAGRTAGTVQSVHIYNRTASGSDVLDKYRNGVNISDKVGSQTALTSGTLTVGKRYKIDTFVAGDDFTNVGGTNVAGNEFIATGTTPTNWTHSSSLRETGVVLALEPEGISTAGWAGAANVLGATYPAIGSSLSRPDVNISTGFGLPTSTGSANAQAITSINTAFGNGQIYTFVARYTNTAAATLNPNSLGAKQIKVWVGPTTPALNLNGGEILAGGTYSVIYDGTQFILMNPSCLVGVTDNSSPSAGTVGELLSTSVGPVSMTSGSTYNLSTQTSLPAGDWDVWGNVTFTPAATTNLTLYVVAVSATSLTFPAADNYAALTFPAGVPNGVTTLAAPRTRISLSVATNIYLCAKSIFTVSTMQGQGTIYARRVR